MIGVEEEGKQSKWISSDKGAEAVSRFDENAIKIEETEASNQGRSQKEIEGTGDVPVSH